MILKSFRILALPLVAATGLVMFQQVALADVTMTLVGVNPNGGFNMGGVYTSPYQIDVYDPVTKTTERAVLLACDDFTTDISLGYSWNADINALSGVTATGPQKFQGATNPVTFPGGTTASYTIQQEYDAAAWLAEQLLTVPTILTNSDAAGYYSYAIWQIFDPTAVNGYGGNTLTEFQQSQVNSLMHDAFSATFLTHAVYIYTPTPLASVSQEFIGIDPGQLAQRQELTVPEESTMAFLAFNFLVLPGIIFLVRRRIRRDA